MATPGCSESEESVILLNKAVFEKLSVIVRNAYFFKKHGCPYTM